MFCMKCGTEVIEGAKFCPKCGAAIQQPQPQSAPSAGEETVTEQPKDAPAPDQTPPTVSSQSGGGPTGIENAVQKNAKYYLAEFQKIDRGGKPKFNWAAFFLGPFFCLYRKCAEILKGYFLIPYILIIASVLIMAIGIGGFFLGLMSVGGILSFAGGPWVFINSIRLGRNFNRLYYQHIKSVAEQGKEKQFGTSIGAAIIGAVILIAALTLPSSIATSVLLSSGGDTGEAAGSPLSTVQNGYLGEYTDMTVKELLDGYYSNFYGEGIWDSGVTDSGKDIVQVEYSSESLGTATIQFSMLDEECFKITAFEDPLEDVETASDLLAALNKFYVVSYELQYSQEELAEKEKELWAYLDTVSASSARYGAASDYTGDRAELYRLFGDSQLDMSVVELLEAYGFTSSIAGEETPNEASLPSNPYEFTDEQIASLEWVSVDSLASYMMPDYDGRWILLTDVYIDTYGYDGTDHTLITAIGINSNYLNITCYDTDTYHAMNILTEANMIGRCVFHEDGKYYEVVDAILYGQSASEVIGSSAASTPYEAGQEAAWNVYANALQGTEGYAVAILYNSDDPDATARAEGFYDEAVSQVGYMPWDTYTYTSNTMTDFTVQLYQCQEAGVEAIYLPVTNQDEFYNLLGMLITQCDAMGFYPTFYDSDGLRIELTIEDVYDYLGLGV